MTQKQKAKEQAVKDIKSDLMEHGRCFVAFRRDLNDRLSKIEKHYLRQQKKVR